MEKTATEAITGHEYLKQMRMKKGLSLREAEQISGVSFMFIKNIEDGRSKPSLEVTLKLLSALGIKTKDFLNVIGYEEPTKGKTMAAQGFEPRTLRI